MSGRDHRTEQPIGWANACLTLLCSPCFDGASEQVKKPMSPVSPSDLEENRFCDWCGKDLLT